MKKLYVGNIPYSSTEEELRELFSEYGEIESLKIIQDQFTDRSRGFGFIEMTNEEDAKKAIETLNGKDFMGKALTVNEARPQQKREGSHKRSSGYGGAEVQEGAGDRLLEIKVNENNVEGALKVLKRKLQKEGLFREIKQRKAYEKPSEKEKRKRRDAQKRRIKARMKTLRFKKRT